MSLNLDLLASVCEVPGAPGFEKKVRDLVKSKAEALGYGDQITIDRMGNLLVTVPGKSSEKKVMAAAHMDEIGFIVTHIDDKGFLRFNPLGGFDPKTLTSQRVIVHGKEDLVGVMGSKPIHIMTPEERTKVTKIDEYFIDLGLPADRVKELVDVGNAVTRERALIELGDCVNVKSLDNRVSVFVLLECLRQLAEGKETPAYDFIAAFTVQEEVGLRGAHVATLAVQPDFGIGLDTTIAYDTPGAKPQERVTELGKGAGIKIMDSSTICDTRMVTFLKKTAEDREIQWQPEILKQGGTDTAGLQRMSPGGAIAGAISVPTRHIHQVIETCHKDDIASCIELLTATVLTLDGGEWAP